MVNKTKINKKKQRKKKWSKLLIWVSYFPLKVRPDISFYLCNDNRVVGWGKAVLYLVSLNPDTINQLCSDKDFLGQTGVKNFLIDCFEGVSFSKQMTWDIYFEDVPTDNMLMILKHINLFNKI